ncbi:AAA-like domain-containing protein [Microseira wollei]|uniref:YD repeat protein n=1 Tax=Microseira wollei NIES-4236 TaxID=2530354 RepID=A0AAV3X8E7_9CYAN|nr:AAA-like domain-containing protein [Microseira wollei]GET38105.1 YD repeat protein [Microseira wollei NIES-4236]
MLTGQRNSYEYKVGGSLPLNAPSYVRRQADEELYRSLKNSEFCYVLNSRQMGKSSLRVQTMHRLRQIGIRCESIDLTLIGSQQVTPEQWYASLVAFLAHSFRLKVNVRTWWRDRNHLSLVNRLSEFLETVLLGEIEQNIVIFMDEIDSVLGLNFPMDDFFALIRACYNKRAENSAYERLTFALLGVATPADLIADKNRTPFNIGRAIELKGFDIEEAMPLLPGLVESLLPHSPIDNNAFGDASQPVAVLQQILYWTGGQPFLTQKLCQIVVNSCRGRGEEVGEISPGTEALWVEELVRAHIIENWESKDEPEHLKTIRERLLKNQQHAGHLLGLYQQILLACEAGEIGIAADDSAAKIELLLSGLVVKHEGFLQIRNPIYQAVFNLNWVGKQLEKLRPYAPMLSAWLASAGEDDSRLLRGKALREALEWSASRKLSNEDYQFLAKSQEWERQEVQKTLEAERAKAIEAQLIEEQKRLAQEQKTAKLQRILLGVGSLALGITAGFGVMAFLQYRKAALSEIQALASSSHGSFDSQRRLDALIEAMKAKRQLQNLGTVNTQIAAEVDAILRQAIYGADEFNRLLGHQGGVLGVAFSPDGKIIATSSNDRTVKLWKRDGTLLKSLTHNATVYRVKFSPDGSLIASANLDGTVKLWRRDGRLVKSWQAHRAAVWDVAFSPQGNRIVSASDDNTLKVWQLNGTLVATLKGHQTTVWGVAFSFQGNLIASAGFDDTIRLWQPDGILVRTIKANSLLVRGVAFSPQGNLLASSNDDGTVKLWKLDGTLVNTLQGHKGQVERVVFSPNGKQIASVGADQTVKLWQSDGTLIKTFQGHESSIWNVTFSPDGDIIATASMDNTVKLWRLEQKLVKPLNPIKAQVWNIAYAPDGNPIALAGREKTIKLFDPQGNLLLTLKGHKSTVRGVAFSPDRKFIASASADKTVKLWRTDGTLVKTFTGHSAPVWRLAFSPDGQAIASTSDDNTIKLWQLDGKLITTFKGHSARVYQVCFTPDGNQLASVSEDGNLILWQRNGTLLHRIKAHNNAVWGLSISPDGQLIATSSMDSTIKLWRPDGTLVRTLKGHKIQAPTVEFSPDGKMLASGSLDNTVKLWQLDGTELITLLGQGGVWDVKFSPDGKYLVSASDEPSVFVWNLQQILHLDEMAYACNWVRDYLRTNAEVKQRDRAASYLCDRIKN